MRHVELVGAAGAFAFLRGKPDVFFGGCRRVQRLATVSRSRETRRGAVCRNARSLGVPRQLVVAGGTLIAQMAEQIRIGCRLLVERIDGHPEEYPALIIALHCADRFGCLGEAAELFKRRSPTI